MSIPSVALAIAFICSLVILKQVLFYKGMKHAKQNETAGWRFPARTISNTKFKATSNLEDRELHFDEKAKWLGVISIPCLALFAYKFIPFNLAEFRQLSFKIQYMYGILLILFPVITYGVWTFFRTISFGRASLTVRHPFSSETKYFYTDVSEIDFIKDRAPQRGIKLKFKDGSHLKIPGHMHGLSDLLNQMAPEHPVTLITGLMFRK